MKEKILSPQFLVVFVLILIAAGLRLLNNSLHMWNFTPISAMALFGGAQFRDKRIAFVIPFATLLITDAIIGFYPGIFLVYTSFLLIIFIGFYLKNRISVINVIAASLASSAVFFIVTNFALFYPLGLYPHTFDGIVESYTAAIPFFSNTVAGDLIYSGLLFGSYYLAKKNIPQLAQ